MKLFIIRKRNLSFSFDISCLYFPWPEDLLNSLMHFHKTRFLTVIDLLIFGQFGIHLVTKFMNLILVNNKLENVLLCQIGLRS